MPGDCIVPIDKFRDYVFKEGATHGKEVVFKSLGYNIQHSEELVRLYQKQAKLKFDAGEFMLGKLDEYGQRIDIEIELPGIENALGQTRYLRTGWMFQPDGTIRLNTPFSGFTR